MKVWNVRGGQELITFKGPIATANVCALSSDGQRLAASEHHSNGSVRVCDICSGRVLFNLKGHTANVMGICFSTDGRFLASASVDRTVKVWDAQTGQDLLTLRHLHPVHKVCFSPDGKRLAAADEKTLKVWDSQSGQELAALSGIKNKLTIQVPSFCFSPDSQRLATTWADSTMKMWDIQAPNGQGFVTFKGHATGDGLCFNRDGSRLASVGLNGMVIVWDPRTGAELLTLEGHKKVDGVCFSSDGKRLASAAGDGTVKVWDMSGSQKLLTLKGHAEGFNTICFSPDDQLLVSDSKDETVRVWDARTGQQLLTIPGSARYNFGRSSLCFSADGQRLSVIVRKATNLAEPGRSFVRKDVRHEAAVWDICRVPSPPHGPGLPFQKHTAEPDRLIRELATRSSADWHIDQAEHCKKEQAWYAAAFHLGWLTTAQPGGNHWQQLNDACEQFDRQWQEAGELGMVRVAKPAGMAWKHAVDALVRILKEKRLAELTLPDEKTAPGLHLCLALAHHRLGNAAGAGPYLDRVQLPAGAPPGLKQLRQDVAAELAPSGGGDAPAVVSKPVQVADFPFKDGSLNRIEASLTDEDGKDNENGVRDCYCKVYTILLTESREYHFDMSSKHLDCAMRLEDAAGKILATARRHKLTSGRFMLFKCQKTATYRIIVTTLTPGTGDFLLAVQEQKRLKIEKP